MKKEVTMHTIICDGCGKNVNEYSDFVAWCDVQGAIEEADRKDWIKLQEKDYCTNCWEWDEKEEEQILKSKKDEIIQEFLMKDNEGIFYELKESNMKTAMQELIDELERVRLMTNMNFVIRIATDLLEKEKEQIINAAKSCNYIGGATDIEAEKYYNQTYNQNK
jgi:uncharacterized OsmC-like protein